MGGNGSLNLYKYSSNFISNFDKRENKKLILLNNNLICNQPIIGFDWHKSKFGLSCLIAFDRTFKICNINNLI